MIKFKILGNLRHTYNVKVPFERTKFSLARLSVFIPRFIYIVLVNSLSLSFSDFCNYFFFNLFILLNNFLSCPCSLRG